MLWVTTYGVGLFVLTTMSAMNYTFAQRAKRIPTAYNHLASDIYLVGFVVMAVAMYAVESAYTLAFVSEDLETVLQLVTEMHEQTCVVDASP